eukprot:999471_1
MATRPTKKRKQVCSGLSSMDVCVVGNMIKHWKLLNIKYYQLTFYHGQYYFCNGEQSATHGLNCRACYIGMNCLEFQESYKIFSDPFICVICEFFDRTYRNSWIRFNISLISNNPFEFMLQPHPNHIKHRNIIYHINKHQIQQITDIKFTPKPYPFSTECTVNKLISYFRKRLSNKLRCCAGIKNDFDSFCESEYGATFVSAHWIYDGQYIVHKDCQLFSKRKICAKCNFQFYGSPHSEA